MYPEKDMLVTLKGSSTKGKQGVFIFNKSGMSKFRKSKSAELLLKLNQLAKDRPFCIMYHAKDNDPL